MFHFLPYSHALSKGSQLWIIQNPVSSSLSKKIDWYLQCPFKKQKNLEKPLLIEASRHLPCRQVLFLPFEHKDSVKWIKQAHHFWRKLNCPSLKLFLPNSTSKEDLTKYFPFESLPYKIQTIQESPAKGYEG